MDKRMGKRALSLVLALEMLCAPMAMARVEDPAQVRAEIPMGDEVQARAPEEFSNSPDAVQPGGSSSGPSDSETGDKAQLMGDGPFLSTDTLAGETAYQTAAIFYGLAVTAKGYLRDYDTVVDAEAPTGGLSWGGYRDPSTVAMLNLSGFGIDDTRTYLFLPDTGRVPDLEFGGFYVYDTDSTRNNTGDNSWCDTGSPYGTDYYWDAGNLENINWSYDTLKTELEHLGQEPVRLDDPANEITSADTPDYRDILDMVNQYGDKGTLYALPAALASALIYGPEKTRNTLPIVGKWDPSAHSEVTTLSVATRSASSETATAVDTAYTANPRGQKADDMASSKVDATQPGWFQGSNTFWIRVDDSQETLDLTFHTYEPYYAYNGFKGEGATPGTPCPVDVAVTFEGRTPDGAENIQVTGQITTENGATGNNALNNTAANPARGLWTVTGIPLTSVSQMAGDDPFTRIVLTVTAPDGAAKTTYTFYVERQMAPEATLAPGNTPYGMIDRDTGAQWGAGEAGSAKRAEAKEQFKSNLSFTKTSDYLYPHGTNNRGGRIYTGLYPNCWEGANLDLDATAVVAYQDRAFADPGVSFRDGEGQRILFGDTATDPDYQICVTRTIRLRTAGKLTIEMYGEDAGTECWYTGEADGGSNALSDTEASQTLHSANGGDVVNLRGLNVLPGVYEIEYVFTDPITGDAVTATRPLVVLPIPGDVDMDGAVTLADAQALLDNAEQWRQSGDPVIRLAIGRVFDVDHNGSLTVSGASSDLSALLAGYQPVLDHDETSDYPYLPLPEPDGISGYQRLTWAEVAQSGETKLTLEYLGLERGTRQPSGHTTNIGGPFNTRTTDDSGAPMGVSATDPKAQSSTYQPDTFWVGVKLSDVGDLAGKEIKDFSFSLIYDSQYVEPAMVYTMDEGNTYPDQESLSDFLFYTYNMSTRYTSAAGQTIFSGMTGGDYRYESSTVGRDYDDTHYSKVVGELEQSANNRNLKEAVFTLRHNTTNNYATVKDGYVMVMAFRLKEHPAGKAEGENVRLIEMAAGMREFVLVTRPGGGLRASGVVASLFEAMERALNVSETYAYSAQGDSDSSGIYGDATGNLRQKLQYTASADPSTGLIPLGTDTTPREIIYNWVEDGSLTDDERGEVHGQYDVPFSASLAGTKTENNALYEEEGYRNTLPESGVVEDQLPPGLSFSNGRITGIPTMAGTYNFSIAGKPYQITIGQKTIRYYAQTTRSYYGQPRYRGTTHSGDYIYRYYTADLSKRDVDRLLAEGKRNDGASATLEWVLQEDPEQISQGVSEADRFTAPRFFARAENSNTGYVEQNTRVGRYEIQSGLPQSVNYKFEYVTRNDAASPTRTGIFEVVRRPVWIDHVVLSAAMSKSSIYDSQKDARVYGLNIDEGALTLGEDEGVFLGFNYDAMVEWPDEDGTWTINNGQNLRLSEPAKVEGDKLTVTISGQYQFDASKGDIVTDSSSTSSYNFMVDGVMQGEIVRAIELGSIQLTGDSANNYDLQVSSSATLHPEQDKVEGKVFRREVKEISIESVPPELYAPDNPSRRTLHPGEWVESLNSLRIKIRLGDASVGQVEEIGTYEYNATYLSPLEVHYNWVSPEDKAEGELEANRFNLLGTGCELTGDGKLIDLCPYDPKYDHDPDDVDDQNTVFTGEMDGWYLCAVVRRYIDGNVEYVKRYSENTITVEKKPLTLTVKGAQRYYGEANEPLFQYTYNVNDLSIQDQEALRQALGHVPQGEPEELELLGIFDGEGCAAPTIRLEDRNGNVMDEYAPVSGNYSIVIFGAKSKDYSFRYAVTSDSGSVTYSSAKGSARMLIYRRPVILEGIYDGKDELGGWKAKNFGTIYADTHDISLRNLVEEDLAENAKFALPDVNREGFIEYYTYVPGGNPSHSTGTSALARPTGDAVLARDLPKLNVSYRACFVPDRAIWSTFAFNYFDQTTFPADGAATRDVELRDLTLGGDPMVADNYVLVYREEYRAQKRIPGETTNRDGVATDVNEDNMMTGARKRYLVSGEGTVLLRPIEELTLNQLGQMDYTYGEVFSPQRAVSGNAEGLKVGIRYATEYENAPNLNAVVGEVAFTRTMVNGSASNSFADRGLQIYYLKSGQTMAEAMAAGQTLDNSSALTVAEHNGVKLFVAGKRGESHELKYTGESARQLTVAKKTLTVTAQDVHRFYGEANGAFTYTINQADLAYRDVEAGHTQLTDLEGYTADLLTFQTDATPDSAVNGESYGTYDLRLSATPNRSLANYDLDTRGATVYVYPRPVRITGVNSSEDEPVYTIYSGNTAGTFHTILYNTQELGDEATLVVGKPDGAEYTGTWTQTLANGRTQELPLTGTAVYGQDRLGFATTTIFQPDDWSLATGETDLAQAKVVVIVTGMAGGETDRNYYLRNERQIDNCWGKIMLRSVDSIYIRNRPVLGYTYGQTLDLSGLTVRVTFKKKDSESTESARAVTVSYTTPEQFQSHGLYVNYWDIREALPESNQDRLTLPQRCRQADSGDHLTIAPTHDTQGTVREFAANGKTLVISAFSAGLGQEAATPKLLGVSQEQVDGTMSWEWIPGGADPATLTVSPLRLEYTLSAADKTYDGTTQAAGTLTLTNLFNQTTQTVSGRRETVTDAVYLPIGAGYESDSRDYRDFTALTDAVQGRSVSFTTGSYTPNGPAPLGANGVITWANEGYRYGEDLTFAFADPNVHYEDAAFTQGVPGVGTQALADYWRAAQSLADITREDGSFADVSQMPVEVSGMRLCGPDAANYTWGTGETVAQVTMTTRSGAVDGQAGVPYATVHKANRSTIQTMAGSRLVYPQLEVDDHTNAIRLTFAQALEDMADSNNAAQTEDPFRSELGFEYALYYQKDGLLQSWAGARGGEAYQDGHFFGGETPRPQVDEGYVPNERDIPKQNAGGRDTVLKGQRYRWAEEDDGFVIDDTAYPGLSSEPYIWYYTLYKTDRAALPRNTVFYPAVRVTETHNYNPSGLLSGDGSVTAEALDAAQKALEAHYADETDEAKLQAAQAASQAVFTAAAGMTDTAQRLAQARVERDAAQAEASVWPDQPPAPDAPASAVKTYTQRLDVLSASRERDANSSDVEYLVEFLESVWFTDTLDYADSKLMDAVVYNEKSRYHGYFWDPDRSAALEFQREPISLRSVIDGIVIRPKGGGEQTISVNLFDERVGGHTAKLYTALTGGGIGSTVRSIRIVPAVLYARLGDAPFQLSVVTNPERPTNRRYTWSSSNPEVASVDENGLVTFRGEGTATITVKTTNGHTASISVVVSAVLPLTNQAGESLFNFQYGGAWANLDGDYAFRPKEGMTRGQLVELLDLFLNPDDRWQATTELAYVDITTRERYYDALRRLTNAGVVTGLPGSSFAGDQLATRAEFVTMLTRMLQLDTPDTRGQLHAFADVDETTTWAYAYIDTLAKTGVIRGVGEGDFAPNRVLTREEAAAIISRLLTTKLDTEQPGLLKPSDMTPENWSYPAVLRAVNAVLFPE